MYKHQKHICKHKSNITINKNTTNNNIKHITNNIDNSKNIKVIEKNKNPLVTVIMNCFNGKFFLKESIH